MGQNVTTRKRKKHMVFLLTGTQAWSTYRKYIVAVPLTHMAGLNARFEDLATIVAQSKLVSVSIHLEPFMLANPPNRKFGMVVGCYRLFHSHDINMACSHEIFSCTHSFFGHFSWFRDPVCTWKTSPVDLAFGRWGVKIPGFSPAELRIEQLVEVSILPVSSQSGMSMPEPGMKNDDPASEIKWFFLWNQWVIIKNLQLNFMLQASSSLAAFQHSEPRIARSLLNQFCRTTVPNKWPVQDPEKHRPRKKGGERCSITSAPTAVCHGHRQTLYQRRSAKWTKWRQRVVWKPMETHCLGCQCWRPAHRNYIVFLRVSSRDVKPAQNTRGTRYIIAGFAFVVIHHDHNKVLEIGDPHTLVWAAWRHGSKLVGIGDDMWT